MKSNKPSAAKIEHDNQVQWVVDWLRSGEIDKIITEIMAGPDTPLTEEEQKFLSEYNIK